MTQDLAFCQMYFFIDCPDLQFRKVCKHMISEIELQCPVHNIAFDIIGGPASGQIFGFTSSL